MKTDKITFDKIVDLLSILYNPYFLFFIFYFLFFISQNQNQNKVLPYKVSPYNSVTCMCFNK